jgi:hypothetical protein
VTLVIPAGSAGDYFDIPLSTSFNYNGVDNLVLDITRSAACDAVAEIRFTPATVAFDNYAYSADSGNPNTAIIVDNGRFDAKFVFAGGDNSIYTAVTSNNDVPFSSNPLFQRVQNLYASSDVDGSGPITGVGIKIGVTTTAQTYTVTVKLGHATVNTLASNYGANYSGSPVTVANAVTLNVPAGVPAGSYLWLPVTGSFNYNGTDNLLLELIVTSATGSTFYSFNNPGFGDDRLIFGPNDASAITAVSGVNQNAIFRFNGGTIDAGIGAGSFSGQVLENDGDGAEIQSLYQASELGTGGTIKSISLRMLGNSNAATHSNYTIRIGHTTKTALNVADTYASNMNENSTVYSGVLDVPAGLLAGDWLTIPINSFNYDPTKNLAIYFSTLGNAGGTNNVRWYSSATRYPLRVVGSETGGSTNPTWDDDGILEIRLGIEK